MTRVPDDMVPDEPVTLGGRPTCDDPRCDRELSPERAALPNHGYCREHFLRRFFDGRAGTCDDCGGPLVYWASDDGRQRACAGCAAGIDALVPKTSDRSQGRL